MVSSSSYVPDRGDVVWLIFDPQAGHEQAGRRPAIVVSPKAYNAKAGLALFCPITTKIKSYPFEVLLPEAGKISGAVLSDQIKSLDWRAREAKLIEKIPAAALMEVMMKLRALIGA
jgi:mRNA interferase MazF